jgi:SsrA-binding protein
MKRINIRNKKATFNYELLDKVVAGIVLKGTEIKSIRNGKANLNEAFCIVINEELFIKGMHISPYEFGTHENHEAKADRKLLLKKKEITKWDSKTKEKGLAIVPLRLFLTDRGLAKVEIALAKGKKTHDKRESLKQKDSNREIARIKSGKF